MSLPKKSKKFSKKTKPVVKTVSVSKNNKISVKESEVSYVALLLRRWKSLTAIILIFVLTIASVIYLRQFNNGNILRSQASELNTVLADPALPDTDYGAGYTNVSLGWDQGQISSQYPPLSYSIIDPTNVTENLSVTPIAYEYLRSIDSGNSDVYTALESSSATLTWNSGSYTTTPRSNPALNHLLSFSVMRMTKVTVAGFEPVYIRGDFFETITTSTPDPSITRYQVRSEYFNSNTIGPDYDSVIADSSTAPLIETAYTIFIKEATNTGSTPTIVVYSENFDQEPTNFSVNYTTSDYVLKVRDTTGMIAYREITNAPTNFVVKANNAPLPLPLSATSVGTLAYADRFVDGNYDTYYRPANMFAVADSQFDGTGITELGETLRTEYRSYAQFDISSLIPADSIEFNNVMSRNYYVSFKIYSAEGTGTAGTTTANNSNTPYTGNVNVSLYLEDALKTDPATVNYNTSSLYNFNPALFPATYNANLGGSMTNPVGSFSYGSPYQVGDTITFDVSPYVKDAVVFGYTPFLGIMLDAADLVSPGFCGTNTAGSLRDSCSGLTFNQFRLDITDSGRVLDCRAEAVPGDPSTLQPVSPIIIPEWVDLQEDWEVADDIFGLTYANGKVKVLQAADQSEYGDGSGGPSNTQVSLYNQPIKYYDIDAPAGALAPTGVTVREVAGATGRPMDIDQIGYDGEDIVIYTLNTNASTLTPGSDVLGDVTGTIYRVSPAGVLTSTETGLPVGGYAKAFADIAATSDLNMVFIDDVRETYDANSGVSTYEYIYTNLSGQGYESGPYTPNTFFDVATISDSFDVHSILGDVSDPLNPVYTNIDRYGVSAYTIPDDYSGGDIEVANSDQTYNTDAFLSSADRIRILGDNLEDNNQYTYYSSTDAAITRYHGVATGAFYTVITPSNKTVFNLDNQAYTNPSWHPLSGQEVDSNFTQANTGYMDKIVFDFANQEIYYKNSSRTARHAEGRYDNVIGKIYCPEPPVNPEDPNDPLNPVYPDQSTPYTQLTSPDPDPDQVDGTSDGFGGNTFTTDCIDCPPPDFEGCDIGCLTLQNASPNTSISKSSNTSGSVNSGDTIVYTLTLTNSGDGAEDNLVVSDVIDSDATFSGTQTCTGDLTICTYDSVTRTISWNIPTLGAGQTLIFNFEVSVN